MLKTHKGQAIAAHVEIMKSAGERTRGMLKFLQAPKSYAAVFELPLNGLFPAIHTFGMKFSIDVIYCDDKKRIRWVRRSVPPNRFILPMKFIFGGVRYLIETSNAETGSIEVGEGLEWGAA